MGLSSLAWVAEAASLALAPIPVTATLRNAGRGLLVVGGGRWLGERFSRPELLGVAMASAGGALTAISVVNSGVSRKLLSNLTQLVVGVTFMLAAGIVVALATRFGSFGHRRGEEAPPVNPGREKAAGIAIGGAVGLLFAGTGVFTKEIGDRFAVYGVGAFKSVLASTGLWMMLAMTVWAQSLLQQAFRQRERSQRLRRQRFGSFARPDRGRVRALRRDRPQGCGCSAAHLRHRGIAGGHSLTDRRTACQCRRRPWRRWGQGGP